MGDVVSAPDAGPLAEPRPGSTAAKPPGDERSHWQTPAMCLPAARQNP